MDQTLTPTRLYQLSDGYCYNSDSLFLFDFALPFMKAKQTLLDVGCGSGILAKLAQKYGNVVPTLIEKDRSMAFLAQINLPDSQVLCQDFLDFYTEYKFDIIISNPPFYRGDIIPSKNPRINLARNEKSLPIDLFLKQVKRCLKPNGNFFFCYDAREVHRVFFALKNLGFNAQVARFVYPKINQSATLALIYAKIQSKQSLNILPPLITHIGKSQNDYSDEVCEIYKKCNTYSIKVHSADLLTESSR
ncbi:hypothetical protein BBW65_01925 [Helicobacter enhydrae]|uniref:Methyltransferase small domain-containing protein n=1 Tax=Helicobacter enhydrae TaxID=222136 RepID=A0A1B1U4G7_9HELI|nr:methyltransferase [Helicobacter enhydrae]ANV97639.1 hypothetical protein BBW65_01925 [Helicobacter enhydrae]